MSKMHNNSPIRGQMKAMENTFIDLSEIFVAILKILYYNGKDFNGDYY